MGQRFFDEKCFQREQMVQKNEKRQRTRVYAVTHPVSGSWFPLWSQGFLVCIHPPCTDEPRIKLQPGDKVNVTRWRKYWLFGDKVIDIKDIDGKPSKVRGWFPRKCAVEITDSHPGPSSSGNGKKTQ